MGLARPNVIQRLTQRVGSTNVGTWAFRTVLLPLDRTLVGKSEGRRSLPGFLLGLPVAMLVTTGARTGLSRTAPVVVLRAGTLIAVLGTNFGQERVPAWDANLRSSPLASITWRGISVRVRARQATEQEETEVWPIAAAAYAGFTAYRRRVTTRQVTVWVLEPAA